MIIVRLILLVLLYCFLSNVLPSLPTGLAQLHEPFVDLIHPVNNSEILSKKLIIQGRFLVPAYPESLLLILDGIDLTGITVVDGDRFS